LLTIRIMHETCFDQADVVLAGSAVFDVQLVYETIVVLHGFNVFLKSPVAPIYRNLFLQKPQDYCRRNLRN
jgi:hypothetical protein